MTKDVKYYRDLRSDERLQAGDERLEPATDIQRQQWQQISAASYGNVVSRHYLSEYRRPVDLPVLQRVTPEAMAELELRDRATIVTCDHDAAWVYRWAKGIRWTADRRPATRPALGWFVDLSTIPEVQQ